ALAGYRENGRPDLLLYRKNGLMAVSPAQLAQYAQQQDLVEDFLTRWFRGVKGESTAALKFFGDTAEFEEKLEEDLRILLKRRIGAEGDRSAGTSGIRWPGNPFRGLEAFELEHAPVFFGRTRAR